MSISNNQPHQPQLTTDDQLAEINEKYEKAKQEIEALRAKIQSLRKQKPNSNHRILKIEFEKYSKMAAEDNKNAQNNNNSKDEEKKEDVNNNGNEENANKQNKDLSKLQCKLREYKKLTGHGNKVYGVDWNPLDSNNLVSVGRDGKLIFWNADTGYKRLAYPLDTEFIMTLKYSPDSKFVACGGLDDILSIFPVREETGMINDIEPQIFKSHTGYISCIQYIDSNTILTSSGDATIREWDLNKTNLSTPKYTYRIHREDVMSISINPQNPHLLLTGSVDSTAKIIDLRMKPNEDDDYKSDAKLSHNGGDNVTHSFYMGYDSDISKKNRTTDVNVVKWFPDGHCFVAGCDDGTVRLFDQRSGRILNEYSYHKHYLNGGASNDNLSGNYSQENNSIVITSTNTPIQNESKNNNDDDDGKAHEPLKASDDDPDYFSDPDDDPTDGVATLDFSKSGAFMFVSYNNDQHKVLAWNVLTGKVVQELDHSGHVPHLVVSPDGQKLVTACWDHHLKLWA